MSEISSETTSNTLNTKDPKHLKSRVAPKGKRLLALLLDFILALLLMNTLDQFFRNEDWDLSIQTLGGAKILLFYTGIFFLMVIRDLFGSSPGRILMGISLRNFVDLQTTPRVIKRILRNFMLLLLPLEGVMLLKDPFALRLADRLFKTVILEHPKPMRIALRLLFGNLLFFSFFGTAILLQKSALAKTAAFKTAEQVIRTHPELTLLLNRFPELEETEMSLDLRKPSGKSLMLTTVGQGNQRNKVRVELQLKRKPLRWDVIKIEIKPYTSSSNLNDF
jgi:hypothetical protein